jgi:hypothetical protein
MHSNTKLIYSSKSSMALSHYVFHRGGVQERVGEYTVELPMNPRGGNADFHVSDAGISMKEKRISQTSCYAKPAKT